MTRQKLIDSTKLCALAGGCLCWQCLSSIGLEVAGVAAEWAERGQRVPVADVCDTCSADGYALAVPMPERVTA